MSLRTRCFVSTYSIVGFDPANSSGYFKFCVSRALIDLCAHETCPLTYIVTVKIFLIKMLREIEKAYERIREVVNSTPVMTSSFLNTITGGECFLKCENFQKTGSFKLRGVLNALSQLSPEQKEKGIITHSSGNHAQALALTAKLLGIKVVIVMPENALAVKVAATRGYVAEIFSIAVMTLILHYLSP